MGKDPGAGDNKDDKIEFNLGACILCLGLHQENFPVIVIRKFQVQNVPKPMTS